MFWVVFSTLGCAPEEKIDRSRQPEIVTERYSLDPPVTHYFLADSGCQKKIEEFKFTEIPTYQLDASGLQAVEVAVSDLKSKKSLTSQSVKETIYGRTYERECNYENIHSRNCNDHNGDPLKWSYIVEETRYLKLCESKRHDRNSLEGVAQASMAAIEKARNNVIRSTLGSVVPKPLTLEILPTYRSIYKGFPSPKSPERKIDYVKFITNNLFYSPSSEMISVFPETEFNYQQLVSGEVVAHLWESPFVLAHEFGHHVEATISAASNLKLSIAWSPLTHQFESTDSSINELTVGHRQYLRFMLGSLSEAFADLVGFYSEQSATGAINQLPTLAIERDPTSLRYADGSDKILDRNAIERLNDPDASVERSPHRIGAIFAYAIARQFQIVSDAQIIDANESRSKSDLQMHYLIQWFKGFRTELVNAAEKNEQITPSRLHSIIAQSFKTILSQMLELVPANEREKLERDLTAVHDAILPGLSQPLF